MTGLTSRTHGDRIFKEQEPMPEVPTLAQCFRDAGYQAYAVGKLHVFPQRNRIGFDDVLLEEQGRHHLGDRADDYELFLAEQGHPGQEYATGMSHGNFLARAWHLPEHCHPINWTASQMCKVIHRRDPTRPAFWYLSFSAPHPPMTPLQTYLDLYRDVELDVPAMGDWSNRREQRPWLCEYLNGNRALRDAAPHEIELANRAFYATCTHIDHQMRVVIGTLREEEVLDNTIIVFTSDHGHMCGHHGQWTVMLMYEMVTHIPIIIVPRPADDRLGDPGTEDDRLAEFGDINPTLLELADIAIPETVEYRSLAGDHRRELIYGQFGEDEMATRMICDGRHKLIYYPIGNCMQLFDLEVDRLETHDLMNDPAYSAVCGKLTALLIDRLYGSDLKWLRDGKLVGLPAKTGPIMNVDRSLVGQRGLRFV